MRCEHLELSVADGVTRRVLNRPEVMNAPNPPLLQDFKAALDAATTGWR